MAGRKAPAALMRQVARHPTEALSVAVSTAPIIPVSMQQMTVTLFGLAIYLFCVHSFKLPLASLGIAIGVVGVMSKPNEISLPAPLLFMAAFLTWCAFTALASPYKSEVLSAVTDYAKILLIFFVALNAAKTLSQLVIFIGTWLLMFTLYPVRGTYFNFLAGINQFGRYGWNFSFSNYNDLAAYAILALAMAAFLLAGRYPKWIRVCAFATALSLALLIVLTQSRGAFVGLILAFVFMVVRSRSRSKLIRFGLLAALGVFLLAPGAVWERFSRMKYLFNEDTIVEADTSAEQRYVLLQIGMTIARENLATGVGLGAYSFAHGAYAEDRVEWRLGRGNRDTHNMYVNLVAETGIPGTMLFLGMLAATLLHSMRIEKRLRLQLPIEAEQLRILRFGLVAYLIAAIFGTFHRVSFLYLFISVLWCTASLFSQLLAQGDTLAERTAPPLPRSLRGIRNGARLRTGLRI